MTRYLVKIYIGTNFQNDNGTNVAIKIAAENEEQAKERAISLLNPENPESLVYEIWEEE